MLSVSLTHSLFLSAALPSPPGQQMVNDSCSRCARAIASVALLRGRAESRVTHCLLFGAGAINLDLYKTESAFVPKTTNMHYLNHSD